MKIAYVTVYDSHDIRNWSGTGYYMAKCLEGQGFCVDRIGSLREPFSIKAKLKQRFYKIFFNETYIKDRSPIILEGYAKQINRKLSTKEFDIVFAPGPIPVSHLNCEKPIVIWTDAVFQAMVGFNPYYDRVCNESVRDAILLEKRAYKNASYVVFASEWAAKSAIELYHIEEKKISIIPFGANIICDRKIDDIYEINKKKDYNVIKLLFVGTDWKIKRGDFVINIAEKLNKKGFKTELHIVGCNPSIDLPEFVIRHGFISKNENSGRTYLNKLYAESHFLIVPSLAECFGIVFAEASSFGLPSLATNVGGIPSVIRDGRNGKLFSIQSIPDDFCKYIIQTISDYDEYLNISILSYFEYQDRINWKVSGEKIKSMLSESL
jgi:glycosyltransferase involved in cell wall biosynthesis